MLEAVLQIAEFSLIRNQLLKQGRRLPLFTADMTVVLLHRRQN
jgi:hypothetical protein